MAYDPFQVMTEPEEFLTKRAGRGGRKTIPNPNYDTDMRNYLVNMQRAKQATAAFREGSVTGDAAQQREAYLSRRGALPQGSVQDVQEAERVLPFRAETGAEQGHLSSIANLQTQGAPKGTFMRGYQVKRDSEGNVISGPSSYAESLEWEKEGRPYDLLPDVSAEQGQGMQAAFDAHEGSVEQAFGDSADLGEQSRVFEAGTTRDGQFVSLDQLREERRSPQVQRAAANYEQKLQQAQEAVGQGQPVDKKTFNQMVDEMIRMNVRDQSTTREQKTWDRDIAAHQVALQTGDRDKIEATRDAYEKSSLNKELDEFDKRYAFSPMADAGRRTVEARSARYRQAREAIIDRHEKRVDRDHQLRIGAQKVEATKMELKMAEELGRIAGTEQGRTQAQRDADNLRTQQEKQITESLTDRKWNQEAISDYTVTMNMFGSMGGGVAGDWVQENTGTEAFTKRIEDQRARKPNMSTSDIIKSFFLEDMTPKPGDSAEVRERKEKATAVYKLDQIYAQQLEDLVGEQPKRR
jgi:hypothetical protein